MENESIDMTQPERVVFINQFWTVIRSGLSNDELNDSKSFSTTATRALLHNHDNHV